MSSDSQGFASTHCFHLLHFLCPRLQWLTVTGLSSWLEHCFGAQGKSLQSPCGARQESQHKRLCCSSSVTVVDKNAAEGTDLNTPWLHTDFFPNTVSYYIRHVSAPYTQTLSCWHHGSESVFVNLTPPPHTLWSDVTLSCFLVPFFKLTYLVIVAQKYLAAGPLSDSSCFHDIISVCVCSSGCRLYFAIGTRLGDLLKK